MAGIIKARSVKTIISVCLVVWIYQCIGQHEITGFGILIPYCLNEYIDKIETDPTYVGTMIYRHTLNNDYYDHVSIPLSSYAYCEVYTQNCIRVDWNVASFEDYLNNRQDEIIIWEWTE